MQTDIVITGIGGQGVQLAAKALATGAIEEGRQAMLAATWGGEMRGGQTEASVVIGDGRLRALPILPRVTSAMVMHANHWAPVRDRLVPGGVVAYNSDLVDDLGDVEASPLAVPAVARAKELDAPMGASFVLLGAFCAHTRIVATESLVAAMKRLVPPYRTQHIEANERCIRAGAALVPAPAGDGSPA